jgi:hypothetical protein
MDMHRVAAHFNRASFRGRRHAIGMLAVKVTPLRGLRAP